MKNQEFILYLKESKRDIIIFGTGRMMTHLVSACQEADISVAGLCDNNQAVCGQVKYNLPIMSLDTIKEKYSNPIFLISIWDKKPQESVSLQLKNNDFNEYYAMQYCVENMSHLKWPSYVKNDIYIYNMQEYKQKNAELLHADNINVFVTEKCSLRCRDCAHFAQFFENPITYKKEDIMEWIDCIDDIFDSVGFLCFMGGEPMLHPDIFELVAYAQTKLSIKCVIITTNGTILPKKEDLLNIDKNKFYLTASDYGDVSTKRKELEIILKEENIDYYNPIKNDTWGDCAYIEFQERDVKTLETIYKECHALHCITLVDNKIFRCPFLAATYQLKGIPKEYLEFANLSDTAKSVEVLKKDMIYYLYEKPYFIGCQWCVNRTGKGGGSIPAGLQTKDKTPYKKYD